MSATILNGTALAKKIKDGLRDEVSEMIQQGIRPGLAVIIAGNNPASRSYVNFKKKDCAEIGIQSYEYALEETTTEDELLKLIDTLNKDEKIHGILVQLPLPKQINEERILFAIDPDKDVDCFHPVNVGRLMIGQPRFLPCTPAGVIELIKDSGTEISGKECVIVGRSNIVGKPQAILLLAENGTVTVCHSKTKNLEEVCRRADILVVAMGRAEFIKADFVKPGAVVIDVGANKNRDNKTVGDVEFERVSQVASILTPPIGGVGPMTRAMLMKNTVTAVKLKSGGK